MSASRLPEGVLDGLSTDAGVADLDGDGDLDIVTGNNGQNFLDVDSDGDLDILTSNADVDLSRGRIAGAPYRVYLNDGGGRFREATGEVLPEGTVGAGSDAEVADFDGDGRKDLFLASRGSGDRLLLRVRRSSDVLRPPPGGSAAGAPPPPGPRRPSLPGAAVRATLTSHA